MDYDLYYLHSGGEYAIHFANNKGLDIEDVKTAFSPYGNVVNVNNRGQVHGLCFVKYKTLKEVKQAIDGLQNHNWIKILRQKSKMSSAHKKDTDKGTGSLLHKGPGSDTSSIGSTKKFKEHSKSSKPLNTENSSKPLKTKTSSIPLKTERSSIYSSDFNDSGREWNIISSSPNFKPSVEGQDGIQNYEEIPALVFSGVTRGNNGQSTRASNSSLSGKSAVVPAAEIIVANVNSEFGIHYILHLFEKYNPIAVSLMKLTPITAVRYCHVYFKSQAEAIATETEFDHYHLNGNSLIVLRPEKLIYESRLC